MKEDQTEGIPIPSKEQSTEYTADKQISDKIYHENYVYLYGKLDNSRFLT